ncbi:MAG: hypothetical protein ABI627_13850 [Polyangiaceae bacterium]
MNNHKRIDYLTRAEVLQKLSDAEVASVSNAESAERLKDGEEYLDLEHLDQGVRHAGATSADMGRVLPRKAVHEATWRKILSVVGSAPRRDGAP